MSAAAAGALSPAEHLQHLAAHAEQAALADAQFGEALADNADKVDGLDDDDEDVLALTDGKSRWYVFFCGFGSRIAPFVHYEVGVGLVALTLVIGASIAQTACSSSSAPGCLVFGAHLSNWLTYASYIVAISIPGRVLDVLFFTLFAGLSELVNISLLNPVFFWVGAFEGAIARFFWMALAWNYDVFIRTSNDTLVDDALRSLLVFQVLAVARNIALRLMLRNVMLQSFEQTINDVLFQQLILNAVSQAFAVGPDGRLVLQKDRAYRDLLRMWAATDFRRKLDFISRSRFRMRDAQGSLVAIARKEGVAPFAKLAFKNLTRIPLSALAAADMGPRNLEEITDGLSHIATADGAAAPTPVEFGAVDRAFAEGELLAATPTPAADEDARPSPPLLPARATQQPLSLPSSGGGGSQHSRWRSAGAGLGAADASPDIAALSRRTMSGSVSRGPSFSSSSGGGGIRSELSSGTASSSGAAAPGFASAARERAGTALHALTSAAADALTTLSDAALGLADQTAARASPALMGSARGGGPAALGGGGGGLSRSRSIRLSTHKSPLHHAATARVDGTTVAAPPSPAALRAISSGSQGAVRSGDPAFAVELAALSAGDSHTALQIRSPAKGLHDEWGASSANNAGAPPSPMLLHRETSAPSTAAASRPRGLTSMTFVPPPSVKDDSVSLIPAIMPQSAGAVVGPVVTVAAQQPQQQLPAVVHRSFVDTLGGGGVRHSVSTGALDALRHHSDAAHGTAGGGPSTDAEGDRAAAVAAQEEQHQHSVGTLSRLNAERAFGTIGRQMGALLAGVLRAGIGQSAEEADEEQRERERDAAATRHTHHGGGSHLRAVSDMRLPEPTMQEQHRQLFQRPLAADSAVRTAAGVDAAGCKPDLASQRHPHAPKVQHPRLTFAHFAAVLDGRQVDADHALALFDTNGDSVVERPEFVAAVEQLWLNFRALKASLEGSQSVSTAINVLLDVLFWLLFASAVLYQFDIPVVQVFVPLGTVLVSASFAIGNSLSNVVSSLIFVLVTRPYGIGDRVTCSGVFGGDETLIVKRVDVLNTTFTRLTNKEVLVPNHQLLQMNIENFKRSPPAVFKVELVVSNQTTAVQLEQLRRRMDAYLATQPLSWKPTSTIRMGAIRDQSIVLSVWLGSHYLWQDAPRLWKAVFAMYLHMLAILREARIGFRAPDQAVHVDGTLGAAGGWAGAGAASGAHGVDSAAAQTAPQLSAANAAQLQLQMQQQLLQLQQILQQQQQAQQPPKPQAA